MNSTQFIALTAIAAALFAGAVYMAAHRYKAVQRGVHAEGTVVDQDEWKPRVRYAIIEFLTERGEKVRFRGPTGMETGAKVNVVYDPLKPANVLITDASTLWGAPVLIAVLGLLIFVPAVLFYLYRND